MARPMLGKGKFWEQPPPTKAINKWVVIKYLHVWHDPNMYEAQSRWVLEVYQDTQTLRNHIEASSNAEILLDNLKTYEEAKMWVKMME